MNKFNLQVSRARLRNRIKKPRDEVTHLTSTSFVHIARGRKHVSSGLDTANHVNTVTDEQTSNCSQIFVR